MNRLISLFVLLLASFVAWGSTNIIQTVAGGGPNNMPALNANLNPQGIAVDNAGNLYIAESQRVFKVDRAGNISILVQKFYGDGGGYPIGVAVDARGNIYISDGGNSRIRKVDTKGIISTVAGNGSRGFSGDGGDAINASLGSPIGLAVDVEGNLYIADAGNYRVRKVDTKGIISTVAGNGTYGFSGDGGAATSASLGFFTGVAVDAGGNLYIADLYNYRIRKVDTTGTISTVAGNGIRGFSGDGGAATSASLDYPIGVAVDAGGNLYIADSYNCRIRKVDTKGIISTVAGNGIRSFSGDGGTATSASLSHSYGVAVDSVGSLYIADSYNYRIRKVDTTGIISTVAGNGTLTFGGDGGAATSASLGIPSGVAVDAVGNLYIADWDNHRVRKVDAKKGGISTVAGNGTYGFSGDGGAATSASLSHPHSVVVDAEGNLYIADGGYRIRKVDRTGTISTVAGNGTSGFSGDGGAATSAGLAGPSAVAVDMGGNIYIADDDLFDIYGNSGGRIRKVDAKGIISTVAGNGTSGFSGDGGAAINASLGSPGGVVVDAGGNLYIADTGNYRIRKVDTTGTISTVAGNGTFGFSGDGGAATSASISLGGLAVDAGGNLYIADSYNYRIRKVDTTGTISTVAGNGTRGFSGDGGAAISAGFSFPIGVAVDTRGNIYAADYNRYVSDYDFIYGTYGDGNRIRKITVGNASPAELNPVSLHLQNGLYTSLETTAKFTGGVALNDSGYQRSLTQPAKQGDTLTVVGTIIPDAQHAGQSADIVVVGASQTVDPHEAITAPDDCNLQKGTWVWYMNTQRDNRYCNWSELPGQERYCNVPKSTPVQAYWQNYWQTWTGNLYELQALDKVTLQKDTPIELTVDGRGPLYKDTIDYRNKHVCINFGYRLKDGTIVFNGDTINFRTD